MSETVKNILYIGHNIELVKVTVNLSSPSSDQSDYCIEHLSCVDEIQAALDEKKYSQLICELPVSKNLTDSIAADFPLLKTTYLTPADTPKATELSVVMEGVISDEVKATLDYLSIPIYFKNRKGQFLACNSYFSNLFGLSPAQVIGKTAADVLHPHLLDGIEKIDQKVFAKQKVYLYECKIADLAGRERDVVFRKESVDNGKIQIGMVFDVTEINKANRLLEEQRMRLAVIANSSPDLIFSKDLQGRFLGCNTQFEKFVGCSEKEIIGKTAHHFFSLEQAKISIAKDKYVIENNKVYLDEEHLTYHNGKDHLVEMKKVPLRDNKGNVVGLVAIGRDITAHYRMQKRLEIANAAFENSKEDLLVTDEKGNIIAVNKAACATTGFSKSELLKANISVFGSNQHENIEIALQESNSWQGDLSYRIKNGDIHFGWVEVYLVAHQDKGLSNRIYSLTGLNKSVEEKIHFLSKQDPLTGLFNRIALFTRLEDAISRAVYKEVTMAVILVNINGFKAVNKQYGHNSGDAFLKEIAERLKRCVFAKDTVARLGGDEFVIVVDELANEQDVAIVAQKIAAQFERSFSIEDNEASLSATIGISICPDDGMNTDALLGNAEKALLRGGNCKCGTQYHFYTKELTAQSNQQFELENKLKQALQQDQFEVYYRPQYDLNKRQVVAVEALLRWNHPQQGLLHSDSFLSLAENCGLLVPIGLEMIRNAALQAVSWHKSKVNFGRVAINLSEQQLLEMSFIADLQTILLETKCASQWLEFEIDEMIFAGDCEIVHSNLLNIHKLGIALTISNYAAERPALYLIEQLGINKLKLARLYTQGASAHFVGPAVSNALAVMGSSLGIDIVAESPENMTEESFSSYNQFDSGAGRRHNKVMKAAEATFYLRCHKRK